MTLWAGRVGTAGAGGVGRSCARDDAELLPYDLQATLLHAGGCTRPGILDDASSPRSSATLARDRATTRRRPTRTCTRRSSASSATVGRKIHAGRSRNDQVAAAFRLYVADACARGGRGARARSRDAILDRADAEATTPMPGYTHLQRAQPVTLGHHLLAWVEMLERDRARFAFAAAQAAPSPLGAGALAGSTLPLPPPPNAMRNSLDAVADRDFALDYLYAVAVLFTHLSRIGEELVLWTTTRVRLRAAARRTPRPARRSCRRS